MKKTVQLVKKCLRRIFKAPVFILTWLLVQCLGGICYDRKYISTSHFGKITDYAWNIAARDLLSRFFFQKNLGVPWPCSPDITYVAAPGSIVFDPEDVDNFWGSGNYFQAGFGGKIVLGKDTRIFPKMLGLLQPTMK